MAGSNIYQYSFKDIDGNTLDLEDFVGRPIMLVNTASKVWVYTSIRRFAKIIPGIQKLGCNIYSNSFK